MKSKPPNPLIPILPRDRQQLRNPRHIPMKRSIKTRNLQQRPKRPTKRFDQSNLPRQMRQIQRLRLPQFSHQSIIDNLILNQMNAPMNHPMPDPRDRARPNPIFQIRNQTRRSVTMIPRLHRTNILRPRLIPRRNQLRPAQPDPLKLPAKNSLLIANRKDGEFNAR